LANGLDAQQDIFASNPDDRRAFEALEEHFFFDGDWEALADLYRARIAAPGVAADPDQQAPLLFRLGQILEERILDLQAASEVYWTLARLDPSNRPALRQLRGVHTRSGKWDLVLQIAELEGAIPMPPYDRAAFETELGQTWQRHLGDLDEARNAFERALEADPEFPPALEGLAALHQLAGRPNEAAEILSRLTDRLRGPERAPVWIALGALLTKELGDVARARQCFERALDDDPFQPPAVEWSLLLAMADEDWEDVSQLLERRFDLAAGAKHRAAVAVEASQIQLNHLASSAGARAWTNRAAELAPDEPSVLFAMAEVERSDGDRRSLLVILDRLISIAGNGVPRRVLIDAAELHAEFGEGEAALEAIRRAATRPGQDDGRLLTLQATLLRESGEKRELAEVLHTLTALEGEDDDLTRAKRLRELARLQEEDLGEESAAETTWQRAFETDPRDAESITALERIHRKHDDWPALRGMFETALDASDDAAKPQLSVGLGLLLLEHFDELSRARELFDAALAADPGSRPALAGLRQIAEASGDARLFLEVCEREAQDCSDPDEMNRLARAAIPILEEAGRIEEAHGWSMRWSEAAPQDGNAYRSRIRFEARLGRPEAELESQRRLARLLSGRESAIALRRLGELHIQLDDHAAAGQALERALTEEPGDRETLEALCGVYRHLDRATELVQTLRLLGDALPSDELAATLEERACLLQDPIGDLEAAIVVRWQLVELPSAPDEAQPKLEDLLEMAGRHAELAQLLDSRRRCMGDESPEAFALDMRRGALLLDSLGHGEEAAEIFSKLHLRHPENEDILDQLERALRVGNDSRGLCDLLEKRAGWVTDDERQVEMHLERASLLEEVLGEPLQACDLYEEILATHPESPQTTTIIGRLEALLESSAQWERLRDRLVARVDALPDQEQATLRERIAAICRDRLHDIAGCAQQLEAIAELVTDRVHVWQQLGEIYAHELDRPADWLRVVEAELETEPTAERELSLRVAAARLCLDDARRPSERSAAEAYEHYERVLALHSTHAEAAEVLAMHFTSEGRHEDTVRILERRLDGLAETGGSEANDLRLRIGALLANNLDEDARARTYFEAARTELGAVAKIADPLADLYDRQADYDALSQLSHEAIARGESELELRWRVRLGSSEQRAGRPDDAANAYRAALALSPDDREIEDALIDLYEEIGETDPLADLLEKRLPYASEDEAIDLRLRLARLHADDRDEPHEALEHLEWILESHPQHRDAFDRAVIVAERIGDPERVLGLLDRALEMPLPNPERASILERRAELVAGPLARPEQAVANLREVLSLDRSRSAARRMLRQELESLGRWPAALDCLFVEANEADPEERIALLEEAVEVAWTRINPDASLPWLARLRAERPEDPELLVRLADVHRRAGRFEAALRAHDAELALRSDPEQRRALHMQRAALLERELAAPGRAIVAYQNALELAANGTDRSQVLAELDRLYASLDRHFERAEILEARIRAEEETGGSSEECAKLRQQLTSLYCVDIAKPELAIPHLEANVESSRGNTREELVHLGALDTALRASARRDTWAHVAERELELIEGDEEICGSTPADYRRFLHEELARTYDADLGDPDRAIDHLRVLCSDPEMATTEMRARLRSLLRRTRRVSALADELASHLRESPEDASDWLELARIREEELGDLLGAVEAYTRAEADTSLELDAIRGRRRCCERLRDWNGLATALEAEYALDAKLDRRQRITIARTLGDVCWQRLGSGDRAAAGYQLALDLDANDLEALRSLIRMCEARTEHAEAIPLYERELDLLGDDTPDRERRFEIWLRLASLFGEEPETKGRAIVAYKAAAELERLSAVDERILAGHYASTDDAAGFAETFASWCDREDSGAQISDHLELARHHRDANQSDAARERAERATELAPEHAGAWMLLAELERDAGENAKACDAFEQAADHAEPGIACRALVDAAAAIDDADVERANQLLSRAAELDPGSLAAHVSLTRVASRQNRFDQTLHEAETALELAHTDERDEGLESDVRLEIALLGARAAERQEERDAGRRLFEIALDVDPDHAEALEGKAEAHFADGDHRAARAPLEHRVELPGENPRRGRHLMMIARGLEADDLLDAAWARFEEAVEIDPSVDGAHDGLARIHERAGRLPEAIEALELWTRSSNDRATRALASLRAAEHAMALEDVRRARACLESATQSDPTLTPAWVLLCELAAQHDGDLETKRLCNEALGSVEPSELSAPIALRAAQLEERSGERDIAIVHYADAVRWEPRSTDAVLSQSRLVRMKGDWPEADAILERFIEAHPDPDSPTVAHVHLERGRLLSGPLEQFETAISAYERALELQPELAVARTALSGLLLHASDRWRDALRLHREILDASPTTTSSLRAVVRLAEGREKPDIAEAALGVLRALGEASPHEADSVGNRLRLQINPGPPMTDPEAERLRRIAHQLREELTSVLADVERPALDPDDREISEAIGEIFAIEDELTAPGLAGLGSDDRAELFADIAALFLDPGGNGGDSRYRDALDRAVGRWNRRKVRRIVEEIDAESIQSHDHAAWGHELRAMAAAQAIDRNGGDLRTVLLALLALDAEDDAQPRFDGTEIATLAATSEPARRLLSRITGKLCDRLEQVR